MLKSQGCAKKPIKWREKKTPENMVKSSHANFHSPPTQNKMLAWKKMLMNTERGECGRCAQNCAGGSKAVSPRVKHYYETDSFFSFSSNS